MEAYNDIEDEEFIVWNAGLGVRVWVTVGRIEDNRAWLEIPYDMVGPICLDTLLNEGAVDFAACTVMTRQRWQNDQARLRAEALRRMQEAEAELNEALNGFNRRKRQRAPKGVTEERACRALLELPLEGRLEGVQIKAAYRKKARTSHPDSGGKHEEFIAISEAKELLMALFDTQ